MVLKSQDVNEVVRNYLRKDDFKILSCERVDPEGISAGFLSAQNKARIRFKTSRGEGELNVFIKTLPETEYHKQNILTMGSFRREVIIFNEVLNNYHQYLKDNTIPECYLARSDEIIVLDDISKKGFKNKDIYETLDLQHCEKVMVALAKFHALSFITEKREGRKMTEIVPEIKTEIIMSKEENYIGRKAALGSINCLRKVIEVYMTHVPLEVVKKALSYLDNLFDEVKSSKLYPNVLAHSDLWLNNVMFLYDEKGDVAEASIIDFQLVTYKSPSYDILLFLHNCTDTKVREEHMDHLMKTYYNVLGRTLDGAGLDIESIMSWDDFENMLKETLPLALAMACNFLLFVLVPEKILKEVMASDKTFREYYEVDRTDYIMQAMVTDTEFNRRIIQAVTNFLNYFSNE